MFGLYQRAALLLRELGHEGRWARPAPRSCALLEPFRGKVPDEVFGEPYVPPVSDGSGSDRNLLRRADALLREAGCKREGTVLKLPDGKPFEIEFLDYQASLQPHTQPFQANLKRLGIEARSRIVDAAQYQRRMEDFDFDMASMALGGGDDAGRRAPDRVLVGGRRDARLAQHRRHRRSGRRRADRARSRKPIRGRSSTSPPARSTGCCAPAATGSRCGSARSEYVAYWDMFARPATRPKYASGAPGTWWYDPRRRAIGKA